MSLHRSGAETGRNVSLFFSTCDLICMCLVGVSSPSVHLGKKQQKTQLYEVKVILSAGEVCDYRASL